jgi:hypothetical protein
MMRVTGNENKVVNDLHEEIMDELCGEPAAIQVKVAFAVLATALKTAARDDPQELRRAVVELEQLMNVMQ